LGLGCFVATFCSAFKLRARSALGLNLLHRINKELEADFDVTNFIHSPTYNPETGEARSYLLSTKKQSVHIGKAQQRFEFNAWETIHTEISKKFDQEDIQCLVKKSGFILKKTYLDSNKYYTDLLLTKP
jgi:uncharacterized SAM-dependent methyltransferase